ncbi:MAG TPA: hypothetical protein VMG09_16780 [Bacteroidota bacterium]|nr:hypothetical protein [Bacteroidota bacterium]
MIRLTMFILCLAVAAFSCSSPNEADLPLSAPGLSTPVATGIYVTSPAGPELLAVWRSPADRPGGPNGGALDMPAEYAYDYLYPNPASGGAIVWIAMPQSCTVDIWVVRARWADDPDLDLQSTLGATTNDPQSRAVRELMRNQILVRGAHMVHWDGKDSEGRPVPTGFYRIYVRFPVGTFWRDLFQYDGSGAIPDGLSLPNYK